jgi:LysR family glycine cleavage system transcriptional activator
MPQPLPPLSALRAFEAAACLLSFKKAAEELAVTATAISHRIRVLEAYVGSPLFIRKVRAVALTPDGITLFAAVGGAFQSMAAAIDQLRHPRRDTVTLSTTPAFAAKWLLPKLAHFQAAHPSIDLHVHASNAPVNLNGGAADLAIRYGLGPFPGATATLLLTDRFAPVANPSLKLAPGQDPSTWPLVHFEWHRATPTDLSWPAWARAAGIAFVDPAAGPRYSEESHAIQAAIAGQGVALLSVLLVQDELKLGLLQVVAEPLLDAMAYHVLTPDRRPMSAAVHATREWLLQVSESN